MTSREKDCRELAAKLRGVLGILTEECGHRDEWRQADIEISDRAVEAADLIEQLSQERDRLRSLVDEQAEDEGLWFIAHTAPEAYLQQELRRLHAEIEGKQPEECARQALKKETPDKK